VSRSFGFEEASAASDSAVGFDDDGLCVTVYKLKGVNELDSEGVETLTYDEFGSGTLGFPLVLSAVDGD
jgi:hypothetical protein